MLFAIDNDSGPPRIAIKMTPYHESQRDRNAIHCFNLAEIHWKRKRYATRAPYKCSLLVPQCVCNSRFRETQKMNKKTRRSCYRQDELLGRPKAIE
eukprot:IDg16730t1